MDLTIPDEQLVNMSAQGRDEVVRATAAFASDLIEESGRLEAAFNTHGGASEITAVNVKDAGRQLRFGLSRRKPSVAAIVARVVSYVGAGIFGYGISSLGTGAGQLAFAIGLIAGAIATFVEFVKET